MLSMCPWILCLYHQCRPFFQTPELTSSLQSLVDIFKLKTQVWIYGLLQKLPNSFFSIMVVSNFIHPLVNAKHLGIILTLSLSFHNQLIRRSSWLHLKTLPDSSQFLLLYCGPSHHQVSHGLLESFSLISLLLPLPTPVYSLYQSNPVAT